MSRAVIRATIWDAEHYTDEQRQEIINSYPEHEREARAKGIPQLGSGRIFPIAEEQLKEPARSLPDHWPRICGLDFGWDHPTAAVWIAWDRDADTIHLYDCYKRKEASVAIHAAAFRARGVWIPTAWPHDGYQHDKGSGMELRRQYQEAGLNLCSSHATFIDGGNGVEAGIMDMLTRMETGRFKVADHLEDWFSEFRLYHRKDGKVVKEFDDLLAATRYAIMMLRFAETNAPVADLSHYHSAGGWMA